MQLVDAEAEAVEGARSEVLHDDVGAGDELLGDLAPSLVLEVEAEAALAAVEPGKPGRGAADHAVVGAGEVSLAAALHFDHVGAQVREVAGSQVAQPLPARRR